MSIRFFRHLLVCLFLCLAFCCLSSEDDPLDKREFLTSLSETRNGVVQKKVISDLLRFKNGKVQSKLLKAKFGFEYIRYRIITDTVYIDHTGTEVREVDLEATATDEDNLTVEIRLKTIEWDIDGIIRITKNDRLRRYYDLAGREKHGKPEKARKKKEERLIQLVSDPA